MRFACEQCQTKYTIPDERVRGKILKIRCKNCNCQITISEGGVRTARPVESTGGDTMIPTKNMLPPPVEEGGDSTMIGGMADFFGGPGGVSAPSGKGPPVDEWYISIDGATAGPMPLLELAQSVVAEEATPGRELFVWREGLGEWRPPAEVEDVKQAVQKERRLPAPKPVSAIKPALASKPQLPAQPLRPGLNDDSAGGSLLDDADGGGGDSEDATQIGSLSMPLGPPTSKPEPADLALEAVDFDVVTDLPAPPQPKSAPPPKPKGPPAFKPPPFPGAGGGPKPPPPKPMSPVAVAPSPPSGAADVLSAGNLRSHHDEDAPGSSQPNAQPNFNEDATGALTGDAVNAVNAAINSPAVAAPSGRQDAYPTGGSQPPMGQMGGAYGDLAGTPAGGPEPEPDVNLKGGKKKTSPLLLGGLAAAALLGIITTLWVVTRPAKPMGPKVELVDAGAAVDAMSSAESVKAAQDIEKDKQDKAKAKAKSDDLLGITAEQRDALLEKNQKALSGCFKKAKKSKLAGTNISVEVTVSAKGKIDTIEFSAKGKELDGKLNKCLQKSVKKWKFPKPKEKSAYQVKFNIPVDE